LICSIASLSSASVVSARRIVYGAAECGDPYDIAVLVCAANRPMANSPIFAFIEASRWIFSGFVRSDRSRVTIFYLLTAAYSSVSSKKDAVYLFIVYIEGD
jgi:hypothetical protein